jgi:hypothetical protein
MNTLNTFITKAKLFFSTYKWLLIPLIPIILFSYFIIIIIASNQSKTPLTNQKNTAKVSQSPITEVSPQTQTSVSPSVQPGVSPEGQAYGLYDEVQGIAFGNTDFLTGGSTNEGYDSDNEFADTSISQKNLSDGSVEYEYQSDDPQRPHLQIVKNDVVLFRRNLMPDDTTTDYYSSYLQNPEYTSQGSSYYGADAMIYASPTSGIAIVFNPQDQRVYEQYLFPAMPLDAYEQKFGKDISTYDP